MTELKNVGEPQIPTWGGEVRGQSHSGEQEAGNALCVFPTHDLIAVCEAQRWTSLPLKEQ